MNLSFQNNTNFRVIGKKIQFENQGTKYSKDPGHFTQFLRL